MPRCLLIANRGEIACRVIRTARRLGVKTIAVYSEADRGALHVRLADEAVAIGPAPARDSYLDGGRIIAAARAAGADAIHPGYGFLSENAEFAEACQDAGLVFVGPPADAIRRMGSKSEARRLMAAAGVPVLPGYDGDDQAPSRLEKEATRLGFPLLVKPTAGGGGKGMRVVHRAEELADALVGARREAKKAFGDERLLLERFVEQGRHVEIQVFADAQGSAVHLFERDCSLQRRHQKVIEEAPAPGLDERTRAAMGKAAVAAARAVGYQGAGTVEFLYDGRDFHFLEMNTRLQVEHPVTEMITGLDLVEWQLRVADGGTLPLAQAEVSREGHAIEARLYAEDPARGFLPSTGRLRRLRLPASMEGVRVDTGVCEGDEVTVHYDPMLAKVIAWGHDRDEALQRLRRALAAVEVDGPHTNARYLWEILGHERVRSGRVTTRLLEQALPHTGATATEHEQAWTIAAGLCVQPPAARNRGTGADSPWAGTRGFRLNGDPVIRVPLQSGDERRWVRLRRDGDALEVAVGDARHGLSLAPGPDGAWAARIDGQPLTVRIESDPDATILRLNCLRFEFRPDTGARHHASAEHEGHLRAPMPGHVLDVRAVAGQTVEAGAVLVVLEAMKMEHALTAPWGGTVVAVPVKPGDRVEEGVELVLLEPRDEGPSRDTAAQD